MLGDDCSALTTSEMAATLGLVYATEPHKTCEEIKQEVESLPSQQEAIT